MKRNKAWGRADVSILYCLEPSAVPELILALSFETQYKYGNHKGVYAQVLVPTIMKILPSPSWSSSSSRLSTATILCVSHAFVLLIGQHSANAFLPAQPLTLTRRKAEFHPSTSLLQSSPTTTESSKKKDSEADSQNAFGVISDAVTGGALPCCTLLTTAGLKTLAKTCASSGYERCSTPRDRSRTTWQASCCHLQLADS